MLSRIAYKIYWMNRYLERAENNARLASINMNLFYDYNSDERAHWLPLVMTTGDQDDFFYRYGEATRKNALHFITFDEKNPNSIASCLFAARENAKVMREVISSEMWNVINSNYLYVKDLAGMNREEVESSDFFRAVIINSFTYMGTMYSTMSREEAWSFGILGMLLERAEKSTRILDMKYYYLLPPDKSIGSAFDIMQWYALLCSADGFEMYRKVHGRLEVENVVAFLLQDSFFPRSVLHCLQTMEKRMDLIVHLGAGMHDRNTGKVIRSLISELKGLNVGDVIAAGIHEYLIYLQSRLNELGNAIIENYFYMGESLLPFLPDSKEVRKISKREE